VRCWGCVEVACKKRWAKLLIRKRAENSVGNIFKDGT